MVQNQLATVASFLLPIHSPRLGVMPCDGQPIAIVIRPPPVLGRIPGAKS
jgi:hypothetical protein